MFSAIYFIIHPSRDMILGFLASGLIAIGFALKDIASSILAGFILLIEKPFQIGDRIRFKGVYGDVISIGLSSVRVLTLADGIVTIPNHLFISDIVDSKNAGKLAMTTTVEIFVSPEADLEKIKELMIKVVQNSNLIDFSKECMVVAKENLASTGRVMVSMQIECNIKDVSTEKSFQTYFILEMNKALKKAGIEKLSAT